MFVIVPFAIFEGTFLVKHFTRFSEEIFTGVIALFFVVETVRTLSRVSIIPYVTSIILSSILAHRRYFNAILCVVSFIPVVNLHNVLTLVTVH